MPAEELIAAAEARVADPPEGDWPAPRALHDRDHWTVYVMWQEFDVAPFPGPAHAWPPALVADLRRAAYAEAYARRRKAKTVGPRDRIEQALAPDDAGLLARSRRERDRVVGDFVRAQRAAAAGLGAGGRRR